MPTRRRFILAAAGLALTPALARCVAARRAPALLSHAGPRRADKLRLACIGVGNRGWEDVQGVRDEHVVALCDVDAEYLARAGKEFPDAVRATDYHDVIASAKSLDLHGVVIGTPDHTHFPIARAALLAGLPVY